MPVQRIAILGGGLGAMSAAFQLTSLPGWQSRYCVDVYQKGWRLGGKGASGRDPSDHDRILEHGLHCFWGFYDNAFGMLRTCYDELARAGTKGFFPSVDDAFVPLDYVHFIDRVHGTWCRYKMSFPTNDQRPGVPAPAPTVVELGLRLIDRIASTLRDHPEHVEAFDAMTGGAKGSAAASLEALEGPWRNAALLATFRAEDAHREALALLDKLTHAEPPRHPADLAKEAVGADPEQSYRRYVLGCALLFGFFAVKGMLVDGVPTTLDGFSHPYDDYDLSAWLKKHGAPDVLLGSPVLKGFYNSSFCHPAGNFGVNDLAAGVALRVVLLMGFTYKGSFMWKMRAGMGDVVFAPLYAALRARGVRFHFFHKVTKLSLSDDQRSVAAIAVDVQAKVASGDYDPLVRVGDLACWPSEPLYGQLENGGALRGINLESDWTPPFPCTKRTLRSGPGGDFDQVVLAIPVGAHEAIAGDLIAASPLWRAMVDNVKTVRTQSVQVWVRADAKQQQWDDANRVMTDVYADQFNSVADMYQTLGAETWPAGSEPGSVVYFSTPMPDDPNEPTAPSAGYQASQDALVEKTWRAWMTKWKQGVFGWLGDGDALNEASFFSRANIDGCERYVLSVAGSPAHRIAPDASGFSNLFLAGDWTKSPLDLGCAENATMSGKLAGDAVARAVSPPTSSPFVEYPGMPVFPPPYRQTGITLCELALPADASKMQRVLDRFLNPCAGPHKFHALGRWVLLQTGFIAENRGGPPDEDWGTASETSASFLVPCARLVGLRSLDIGFFAPIVLVSHPLSMIAGREVLGMAKHLASFAGAMPAGLDDTTVTTMALRARGTDNLIEPIDLIRVTRRDGGATSSSASHPVHTLLGRLARSRSVSFFNLRQQRAVRDPQGAATLELVRGRMRLGHHVDLEPLAGAHTVEIVRAASHPIADLFGLASGPIEPVVCAKMQIDRATLDVEEG